MPACLSLNMLASYFSNCANTAIPKASPLYCSTASVMSANNLVMGHTPQHGQQHFPVQAKTHGTYLGKICLQPRTRRHCFAEHPSPALEQCKTEQAAQHTGIESMSTSKSPAWPQLAFVSMLVRYRNPQAAVDSNQEHATTSWTTKGRATD